MKGIIKNAKFNWSKSLEFNFRFKVKLKYLNYYRIVKK
jgi:hypothetical protein